jgi:hypothetical protein
VAFFTFASNLGPGDTNTRSINDQVNFTDHPGSPPTSISTAASQAQFKERSWPAHRAPGRRHRRC